MLAFASRMVIVNLPPSLAELLIPEKTCAVCVIYYPTRRPNQVRIKVAATKALEFNLGCILASEQPETIASIRQQLEARRYVLDSSGSSRGKLVFRYLEE